MKNVRYLQQTDFARIEPDLVLTRIGELALRDLNTLVRGLLYPNSGVSAIIVEGLISSPGSGLSVDITAPAIAVQKISDGSLTNDVSYVADANGGSDYNIVLDTADGSNDRIDILEAQIRIKSEFTDTQVSIVDPVTKTVSAQTRDRDFEVYLFIQKKTGTPAGTPVPPSVTSGTAGSITGTVDINTSANDLSSEYILSLAIGIDSEFVEIDLRGATPSATTAAEILANINAAGFGVIATLSGNYLKITAPGTGENSIVKIKQTLDSTKDAYAEVLGGSESAGYYDTFPGVNDYFKIAEIFIPTSASSLTAANVRSREEKDTDWGADASTIENAYSFDAHRKSNPIDHADASIFVNHLDSSVKSIIQSSTTNFIGLNSQVYKGNDIDETGGTGQVRKLNTELKKVTGDSLALITDINQEYPVNRVDQRNDNTGGSGYSVPVALSESATDKRSFIVGVLIDDGTNYYSAQSDHLSHSRVGVYVNSAGSGYTHLRITLHNAGNTQLGQADIAIADLSSVAPGWIYVDMSATLTDALTYHYHFEMIGETSPTAPVLANSTGSGADTLAFREMYIPTAGDYGTSSEEDLCLLLDIDYARTGNSTIYDTNSLDYIFALTMSKSTFVLLNDPGIRLIHGTVTGSTLSFGSTTVATSIPASNDTDTHIAHKIDSNAFVVTFPGNAGIIQALGLFTISGTTVVQQFFITETIAGTLNHRDHDSTKLGQNRIASFLSNGNDIYLFRHKFNRTVGATSADVDNTTASSVVTTTSGSPNITCQALTSDKILLAYSDTTANALKALTITMADLTPTVNSTVDINTGALASGLSSVMLDENTILLAWDGNIKLVKINGTNIYSYDLTAYGVGATSAISLEKISETKALLLYTDAGSGNDSLISIVKVNQDNTITLTTPILSNTIASIATRNTTLIKGTKIISGYADPSDSNKGNAQLIHAGNMVAVRNSGDDTITNPGDGFIGASTGTNFDYIPVDFSDDAYWQTWKYEDYIGIDFNTGRVKVPSGLIVSDLFAEFTISEMFDSKGLLRHGSNESVEDFISRFFPDQKNFTVMEGSIGIGSNNPQALLEINESSSTDGGRAILRNPNEAIGAIATLYFATGSGIIDNTNAIGAIKSVITQANPSALKAELQFFSNSGDTLVKGLTITDAGDITIAANATIIANLVVDTNTLIVNSSSHRVGIGISTPDTNLHIYASSAGSVSADSEAVITIERNGNAYLHFLTPTGNTAGIYFGVPGYATYGYIAYNHSVNYLNLHVGPNKNIMLNSNGALWTGPGTSALYGFVTTGHASWTDFATDKVIRLKILDIGAWDMDTTYTRSVAHGLSYAKILKVEVIVKNDPDTARFMFGSVSSITTTSDSYIAWDSTNIIIWEEASGYFDSTNFDTTASTRGYILVWYAD